MVDIVGCRLLHSSKEIYRIVTPARCPSSSWEKPSLCRRCLKIRANCSRILSISGFFISE